MLSELRSLHREIQSLLDEMDDLTSQSEPPLARLPVVRLALTRASRRRHKLLDGIYDQLIGSGSPRDRVALHTLRAEGRTALIASMEHIGRWSLPAVAANWNDYRSASATVRSAMRSRIKQEVAIVYPALVHSGGQNAVAKELQRATVVTQSHVSATSRVCAIPRAAVRRENGSVTRG
jgi:hypothetical protein